VEGYIVIGEEKKHVDDSSLDSGRQVGSGEGPAMDVIVDPIEGAKLLATGQPDVISVAAAAPRGAMWSPRNAVYMDKIVVDNEAASALVPECMEAPAAWTLALVARVKGKDVRDLVVFVLDRPRHHDLVREIQDTGARVLMRSEGDVSGALMAVSPDVNVDVLMGIGGVSEGIIAACAVKALGGAMLGRLAPQSDQERAEIEDADLDPQVALNCEDLVAGEGIFFAATGITDGVLLHGVRYHGTEARTESLVLRHETGTLRFVKATHRYV
jgi:fructose-1,6-bisphosphatase II